MVRYRGVKSPLLETSTPSVPLRQVAHVSHRCLDDEFRRQELLDRARLRRRFDDDQRLLQTLLISRSIGTKSEENALSIAPPSSGVLKFVPVFARARERAPSISCINRVRGIRCIQRRWPRPTFPRIDRSACSGRGGSVGRSYYRARRGSHAGAGGKAGP